MYVYHESTVFISRCTNHANIPLINQSIELTINYRQGAAQTLSYLTKVIFTVPSFLLGDIGYYSTKGSEGPSDKLYLVVVGVSPVPFICWYSSGASHVIVFGHKKSRKVMTSVHTGISTHVNVDDGIVVNELIRSMACFVYQLLSLSYGRRLHRMLFRDGSVPY